MLGLQELVLLAQVSRVTSPIVGELLLQEFLWHFLPFLSKTHDLSIGRIDLHLSFSVHWDDLLRLGRASLLDSHLVHFVCFRLGSVSSPSLECHSLVNSARVQMTDATWRPAARNWSSTSCRTLCHASLQWVVELWILEERYEELEGNHAKEGVG